jgi:hypothetical protein
MGYSETGETGLRTSGIIPIKIIKVWENVKVREIAGVGLRNVFSLTKYLFVARQLLPARLPTQSSIPSSGHPQQLERFDERVMGFMKLLFREDDRSKHCPDLDIDHRKRIKSATIFFCLQAPTDAEIEG